MKEMQKRAVIYCRVSTKEQVDEGNSLVTQERLCREYALRHGYEVVYSFIEQGESAKTANRTELQKLLSFCADRKNAVQAVIAYRIDRISRNTDDYSQIRILLKKYGVEIKSTSEHFDNDPAGRFLENIIANVAQFDNDIRTERSINGMKEAMREGRYVWKAPLGYRNARVGGKATIVTTDMAPLIKDTFLRIAQNRFALEDVRKWAVDKGFSTPNRTKVSKGYFYRLLKNKVYAGWIIKLGECHKGLFEPIVTDELFEQVQLVLKYRKRRSYTYKIKHPDFPLRRFFRHPNGRQLSGSWSKGRRMKYAYYFFRNLRLFFPTKELEEVFMRFLDQFRLEEQYFPLFKQCIKTHLVDENKSSVEKAKQFRKYLEELKQKQSSLIQKNLQGIINDTILKEQLELNEQEILKTNTLLANLPDNLIYYDELMEKHREFVISPGKTWAEMPFLSKLKLQWFYFPKGVIYDGKICRTTEICSILKAKTVISERFSPMVPLKDQSTYSPEITTSEKTLINKDYWDNLAKEIVTLEQDDASEP